MLCYGCAQTQRFMCTDPGCGVCVHIHTPTCLQQKGTAHIDLPWRADYSTSHPRAAVGKHPYARTAATESLTEAKRNKRSGRRRESRRTQIKLCLGRQVNQKLLPLKMNSVHMIVASISGPSPKCSPLQKPCLAQPSGYAKVAIRRRPKTLLAT